MSNWDKFYEMNKQTADAWANYNKLRDTTIDIWKTAIKDIEQKYNVKYIDEDYDYEGNGLDYVGNFQIKFEGDLTTSKIKKIEKEIGLDCLDFEINKNGGKVLFEYDGI